MSESYAEDILSGRLEVVYPDDWPGAVPEIGLVIPTFNRPEYMRPSFASLGESRLEETLIAIVDDASTDPDAVDMIRSLRIPGVPVIKVFKRRREGFAAHESVRLGWDILSRKYGCRLLASLDSDTIVKPDWLLRIRSLYERERPRRGPLIATGFNANTHPVVGEEADFYLKKVVGGINMFFDAAVYRDIVRPNLKVDPRTGAGWDWHVIHEMERRDCPFLCTKPSVVQHIGAKGVFSTDAGGYDVALDF